MADFSELTQHLEAVRSNTDRAMAVLGSSALALMKDRIYGTGKAADENQIGSYSTKETLVGRQTFITGKAASRVLGSKQKRAALRWVTINGRRLAVLAGGYKKIRELEGRQTNFVDLRRSGTMENAHSFQTIPNGFEIGFTNEKQGQIMAANEKRFGKPIAILSESEIEALTGILLDEVFE